jgi:hypothetical protein
MLILALKCFGERPTCSRCVRRDEICVYDAAEGISRQQDLRSRLQSVEAELGQTKHFIHSLQHSSNRDAATLLKRLRLGEGVARLANTATRRPVPRSISTYNSDLQSRVPQPYHTNVYGLSTQPSAVESQQAQPTPQPYAPTYGPPTQTWQHVNLLPFTIHSNGSFVTEHVSQLYISHSPTTSMRPTPGYDCCFGTDQNARITPWSELS